MTSQFKFQGSLKGIMMIAAATVSTFAAMQVQAQVRPPVVGPGGRNPPTVVRPQPKPAAPRPVIVKPLCSRGGPGITPC